MLHATKVLEDIRPQLNAAEEKRQYHYRRTKPYQRVFIFTLLVVIGLIIYAFLETGFTELILGIMSGVFLLGLIVYGVKYTLEKNKFKTYFQREVVARIIPRLGSDFTYEPEGALPEEMIKSSEFFQTFNRYRSEDLIQGTINDRKIAFAEIKLIMRTHSSSGSSSSSKSKTIFVGIFFTITMTRAFPSSIWLIPRRVWFNRRLQRVKAVDLPKPYRLYAEDPDFATQIFQQPVIDKLYSINQDFKARKVTKKDLYFAFIEDNIRVAIPTRNKFMDPDLNKPVNGGDYMEKQLELLNDLARVAELV